MHPLAFVAIGLGVFALLCVIFWPKLSAWVGAAGQAAAAQGTTALAVSGAVPAGVADALAKLSALGGAGLIPMPEKSLEDQLTEVVKTWAPMRAKCLTDEAKAAADNLLHMILAAHGVSSPASSPAPIQAAAPAAGSVQSPAAAGGAQ